MEGLGEAARSVGRTPVREQDFIRLGIEAARIEVRGGDCLRLLADELHRILDIGVAIGRWPMSAPQLGVHVAGGVPNLSPEEFAGVVTHMRTHPMIQPAALIRTTPFRLSDEVRLRQFWQTETWWYIHGIRDGRYPGGFSLGLHGDKAGMVGLHRFERDFSDDDLRYLDLLREPLQSAFRFRASLDRAVRRLATADRTEPGDDRRLTPREWDVLALVATGRTNVSVGAVLGITERTVRKHLTNAYAKLEVTSRTAAAIWYRNATASSPPRPPAPSQ
jgi:DNA-binding CsgD family transcriptional regulator